MDPEATLRLLREHIQRARTESDAGNHGDALEALGEARTFAGYLIEWLDKGGYAPDGVHEALADLDDLIAYVDEGLLSAREH